MRHVGFHCRVREEPRILADIGEASSGRSVMFSTSSLDRVHYFLDSLSLGESINIDCFFLSLPQDVGGESEKLSQFRCQVLRSGVEHVFTAHLETRQEMSSRVVHDFSESDDLGVGRDISLDSEDVRIVSVHCELRFVQFKLAIGLDQSSLFAFGSGRR